MSIVRKAGLFFSQWMDSEMKGLRTQILELDMPSFEPLTVKFLKLFNFFKLNFIIYNLELRVATMCF